MNREPSEIAVSEDTSQRTVSGAAPMSMQQFEAWVSDHYEDLVGIARTVSRNDPDGVDLLHNLIESVCAGEQAVPSALSNGWFATRVYGMARNHRGSDQKTQNRLKSRFAESVEVLGLEDTMLDLTRLKKANNARRQKVKRAVTSPAYLEAEAARELTPGHLFYGPMQGNTRWRFQQMRDGCLFDERAVRSLAESMHRASHRYRHMGEHGFSHTEWGTEQFGPGEVQHEVPWAHVSHQSSPRAGLSHDVTLQYGHGEDR